MVIDEIIIEKKESDLNEIQLEIKENKLIAELTNLEIAPKATEQIFKSSKGTAFSEVKINGDKNLISKNIKKDTVIFGVAGDNNVVDTSDAQLSTSYLHPNYSGYAKGKKYQGEAALINSKTPMKLAGVSTIINPEYPYFILTHQWEAGQIKGEIVKINSEAINTQAFADKNICIRANYNPEVFGEKAWNVEIAVCDWGYKFRFKSSSGYWCIICKDDITNESKPYTLYHQQVKELADLTVNNWSQRDVQPSNYMDQSIGKSGTFYCYSRDNSSPSTGLGSSKGVEGNYGKILVKNNIIDGFTKGFLDSKPELYNLVEQNTLAEAIDLKAEDIKEGKNLLGVDGTLSDSFKTTTIANGSTSGWHSNIHKSIIKIDGTNLIFGTNMNYGFYGCTNLQTIENCDFSQAVGFAYGFSECTSLEKIKINAPNANTYNALFWQCGNLKEVELILSPNATDARAVFEKCTSLVEAPLFETGKATTMAYFCSGCRSLTTLPEYNTSSVSAAGLGDFIKNCSQLTDESLDNMLKMCLKSKVLTNAAATWRTLKSVGFTQDQLARCEAFESYKACLSAGWSTGY